MDPFFRLSVCGPDCIMLHSTHVIQARIENFSIFSKYCVFLYLAEPLNHSTIDTASKEEEEDNKREYSICFSYEVAMHTEPF